MRYFEVIESEQRVVNVIIYDGVSPYTPPVGQYLISEIDEPNINMNWTKIDGVWTAPVIEQNVDEG
jgi:hypothetical protein